VTFAAIVTVETLKEFLAPVAAHVDECKVKLTPEGLAVAAVDPANVAMVDAQLDADAFESYEADTDEGVIGINLDQFSDVLGFGDSSDLVHLELNEATRKLDVQVGSLDYTLALIDPASIRQEPDIPELDPAAEIVVEGQALALMADAADMVADHITFGVDAARSEFYAEGQGDTDDARVAYDADDLVDISGGGARSLYSLDYVTDTTSAIPDEAEVRVELGDEYPTKWHYDCAEGRGTVTTLIAPRIQTEG